MTHAQHIVAKLWNYCNVLRDDGLSYGDYVEQLTYLLFLKMADERAQWGGESVVADGYGWPSLLARDGDELDTHYRHLLAELGRRPGMLGLIFRKAQNRIQDPAKLRRLIVELIDREEWSSLDADVKGDAYEGLLEKNAQDTKGGAGQYFTPRPLIGAIVDVMRPRPGETVCDPACGTGGFLLAAHDHVVRRHGQRMSREQKHHLKHDALRGIDIVDGVARLCAMNLLLHGVGPMDGEGELPIGIDDALCQDPRRPLRAGAHQSAVRPQVERAGDQRRGRRGAGGAHGGARRLLGEHIEQAAQLPAARAHDPEDARPRGGRGAGQRAVRGRRRRNRAPQAAAAVRRTHPAAPADRDLLRAGRQGERALLRPANPAARSRGRASCGSTICAPTSTSPSSRTRLGARTWTSSSGATIPRIATSGSRRGPSRIRTGAGVLTSTTS